MGGLFCANFLARGGMKTLLIERHSMLGGYCSTFRRNGYLFDAATHFYPLLGNPDTITGKLVAELDLPTEWIKMDPVDQFHLPGMGSFAVPADLDAFLAKLKTWFPDESQAIDKFFLDLRQAYLYGLLLYFREVEHPRAVELSKLTLEQKLNQSFHNPALKTLLMADGSHWGSVPGRTSYLFDAMLRLAYFLGNYYPRGSSQRFADDLGATLQGSGGNVLRCAEVERILVKDGQAQGVRVKTLSRRASETFEFRAPFVVSNADAIRTYRDLLGGEGVCGEMLARLEPLRPSYPCSLVHHGLRGMDPKRLADAEGYYWSSHDPNDILRNVFKIFVPTRFDPDLAPPGGQILIVQKVTPIRLEEIEDWAAHKAELEFRIGERLREILPGIDDHIVVRMTATAMTSHRYTNNEQGAMLGWEMSPGQLGKARPPIETPIENLYLAGHWTRPGGGVTPAIISGHRVARRILSGRSGTAAALEYLASAPSGEG